MKDYKPFKEIIPSMRIWYYDDYDDGDDDKLFLSNDWPPKLWYF